MYLGGISLKDAVEQNPEVLDHDTRAKTAIGKKPDSQGSVKRGDHGGQLVTKARVHDTRAKTARVKELPGVVRFERGDHGSQLVAERVVAKALAKTTLGKELHRHGQR